MAKSEMPDRFERFQPPEGVSWVEYNRTRIEREAASDGCHAWVFRHLLQSLEERK